LTYKNSEKNDRSFGCEKERSEILVFYQRTINE